MSGCVTVEVVRSLGFVAKKTRSRKKVLSGRSSGEGNRRDVGEISMLQERAAGPGSAASADPELRRLASEVREYLASERDLKESRSGQSSIDFTVRPKILYRRRSRRRTAVMTTRRATPRPRPPARPAGPGDAPASPDHPYCHPGVHPPRAAPAHARREPRCSDAASDRGRGMR